MARCVRIGDWTFGRELDFLLIAGPCAIEGEAHAMRIADSLKEFAKKAGVTRV